MKSFSYTIMILFLSLELAAQEQSFSPPRIYLTTDIMSASPPVIDGILNDSVWSSVDWGTNFVEVNPDENTLPSVQTKFKILYDQKHLYIALKAFDPDPSTITNRLSRRDGFVGDRINVLIDSYHDLRTAFLFTVTAAGVRGDEFVTDNGKNFDDSWNPIWTTEAVIDDEGWSAEMKIPLSQLRFNSDSVQVWGLNVARNYFKKNELSAWDRIPVGSAGWVSEAGELHGLKNIDPQKQIEIQPFTVTKLDYYEAEIDNPYLDGNDFSFNAGLDAKFGITNDLTLDVTINPDFGQVEADPAAIALDGFEVFNRDQRPFFVENKNIFNYQFSGNRNNLFFSRRIGRNPQLNPEISAGSFINKPKNTTILGAAKFSGKTKNGWSIGILESMTSKEFSTVNNNGVISKQLAEPFTNYFVSRVQKDFNNNNTFLGGMFTSTNRSLNDNESELRKSAYSAGVDFKHQWQNRAYYVDANMVVSHVKGSKESIKLTQENLIHLFNRVDASHLEVDPNRTSLTGTGGRFDFGKVGGKHWNYNGGFTWVSPELELNDLGYLRSSDDITQFANIRYRIIKPARSFRNFSIQIGQFSKYDFEGNHNRMQYDLNTDIRFVNNWTIDLGGGYRPVNYSNSTLRGGPRWRISKTGWQYFFIGSDNRKKFYFRTGAIISQWEDNESSLFKVKAELNYQPSNALNISLEPEYNSRPNKTQYITQVFYNEDNRYVLGTIDNQTFQASLRINYTLNPNLSIQYYGQPFVSRGVFKDIKYVTNPTATNLNDRFKLYSNNQISQNQGVYNIDENIDGSNDYSFDNPNFSQVQFASNLVIRWEYIPGSELFLVWSQGINSGLSSSNGLFEDFGTGILNQRPQNIFLLKVTYRFVL
jgi:hypothetical protein